MPPVDPSLAELLRRAIQAGLAEVHTSLPGIVVTYDKIKKTADVRPAVHRAIVDEAGNPGEEKFPVIANVPVQFIQGKNFSFQFDLEPGDAVTLIFSERSDTDWRKSGVEAAPRDQRLHGISSCVAIPGRFTDSEMPPDETEHIGKRNGPKLFFSDSVLLAASASPSLAADFVALAAQVDSNFQDLLTLLRTWTVVPSDGGAALQVAANALYPVPPGSFAPSVAATKLKAE